MKIFRLVHKEARRRALSAAQAAPDGYVVRISQPTRSLDQNAKFHAICGDLEKLKAEWAGRARTEQEWKVLLVSGHAVATKQSAEVVIGLEGELVSIRESTASMTKPRSSSLIEYSQAFLSMKQEGTHE